MRELRGVVKRLKRTGPGREPCGTSQVRGHEEELCGGIPTVDVRDEMYEENNCSETEEMMVVLFYYNLLFKHIGTFL